MTTKTITDTVNETVVSTGKGIVKAANSETTKQIIKTSGDALKDAGTHLVTTVDGIMDSVATAFPEVTGKGFSFYAHYVFARGLAHVIEGLFLIALGFFFFLYLWRSVVYKKAMTKADDNDKTNVSFQSDNYAIAMCIGIPFLIIMLFCTMQGVYAFTDGIVGVIAPEGIVVKDIISHLPTN